MRIPPLLLGPAMCVGLVTIIGLCAAFVYLISLIVRL